MKPAALLLLLVSCASIVGDDYVIIHEEPEPEPDCQPIACPCGAPVMQAYVCFGGQPIGCDGVQHVDCPDTGLYWCCEI